MAEPVPATVRALAPPTRRKRFARIPTSAWLAIVLAFVAFVGAIGLLGGTAGALVAAAAHDLPAGAAVGIGDFRFVSIDADADVMDGFIPRSAIASVIGQFTARPIRAGEVIPRSALESTTIRLRAISIPIESAHAVAGTLRRGDVVDVADASGDTAVWVAAGVQVTDVGGGDPSRLGSVTSKYSVTVAVSDPQALAIAAAIARNKIEVVRSGGAPAAAVSPPTTAPVKR